PCPSATPGVHPNLCPSSRSGGQVFPSLSEFSTVYCDPHSQRQQVQVPNLLGIYGMVFEAYHCSLYVIQVTPMQRVCEPTSPAPQPGLLQSTHTQNRSSCGSHSIPYTVGRKRVVLLADLCNECPSCKKTEQGKPRKALLCWSYSEPVDVKSAQPPQLINAKPPSVFPGPSQAHSALYLSSHYHQQPGMNPHLTAMHPSLPRSIAPKANNQMPVTVSIANMAVSPPPPLQISPPLHQHLNLQQHQPLSMQQPLGTQLPMQVQPALHSPTMQQGFNLQPDYQAIISPTSTAAQVVTQAMEYVRSGCRNPPTQPVDWSNDYCSSGGMQRDKALYLT
ncbi:hypothetical protein FD755_016501, partial [Muntiacus reevesi]